MEEICSHTCTLSSRRHVFYLSFSVFASKEKKISSIQKKKIQLTFQIILKRLVNKNVLSRSFRRNLFSLLSGVFAPKRALKKEIKPPFWQVFEKKVECMILYAKTTS